MGGYAISRQVRLTNCVVFFTAEPSKLFFTSASLRTADVSPRSSPLKDVSHVFIDSLVVSALQDVGGYAISRQVRLTNCVVFFTAEPSKLFFTSASLRTADVSPRSSPLKDVSLGNETSLSGDERGETYVSRLLDFLLPCTCLSRTSIPAPQ